MHVLNDHSYCAYRSHYTIFNLTHPILSEDTGLYGCPGDNKSCMAVEQNIENPLNANHWCYPFDSDCPVTNIEFEKRLTNPIKEVSTDQAYGNGFTDMQASQNGAPCIAKYESNEYLEKTDWMLFPEEYFEGCVTEINGFSTDPMYSHVPSWDYQNLTEYDLWSDND